MYKVHFISKLKNINSKSHINNEGRMGVVEKLLGKHLQKNNSLKLLFNNLLLFLLLNSSIIFLVILISARLFCNLWRFFPLTLCFLHIFFVSRNQSIIKKLHYSSQINLSREIKKLKS